MRNACETFPSRAGAAAPLHRLFDISDPGVVALTGGQLLRTCQE